MRTRWFDRPLETVAMVWRIERRDGIALGFIAHDRDVVGRAFPLSRRPGHAAIGDRDG